MLTGTVLFKELFSDFSLDCSSNQAIQVQKLKLRMVCPARKCKASL